MKRKLSYLLLTVMLTSLLSIGAWAAETAQPHVVNQPDIKITVSDVNPEYAALGVRFTKPSADCMTAAETTVNSLEEASDYLCEQMENRVTDVTIYVANYPLYGSDEEYDAWIAELTENWKVVLYGAFEHTGVSTQGDYLTRHYGKSTGNVGYKGSAAVFTYSIIYDTTLEQENMVGDRIDELFAQWEEEVGFSTLSDYGKIKTIYDYICANVVYDDENLNNKEYTLKYSAYAALINGTAVCQGYANLFYRMALEAGIDNRIIVGYGGGGYHGWNIVDMGEKYYYVDSTWDAGRTTYRWFLLGSQSFLTDHTPDATYVYDCNVAKYPIDTADYVSEIASGTCGETLTWNISGDGILTISGEGAMDDYGRFSDFAPWDEHSDAIVKIVLGEGVTTIGSDAFLGCENVTSVILPGSVERLGEDAFAGCTSLTAIELPDSVTHIGDFAFSNCRSLESVSIPDGITTIAYCLFSGCDNLTNVIIPASVTIIDDSAFYGCESLTAICYTGSEEQWNAIEISTEEGPFPDVTVIYNWDPNKILKQDPDGTWRYYVNDAVAADYTGLVTHTDGKTYYVFKGVVPTDYIGLYAHSDGKIYYIYKSVAQKNYVGLYAHTNGVVYYIDEGTVSSTYTGLYAHSDGNTYYVYQGVIPTNYIGLCYHTDGKTYYIYKGVAVSSYTGLYNHTDGKVYYINEGVIDPTFIGLYTHTTGATYYVYSGVVLTSYVGLYLHTDGQVYYVYNGVLVPTYVGFYFHTDGKLYYMSEGVIAVNYTGLAQHSDGKLYYVVSGVFDPTYNGTVTFEGNEYEVVNGIAQP